MHEYEIRILRADRTTDVMLEVMHLDDNAAVRAAKKFAEARPFEVWRGADCIYGRPDNPTPHGSLPPRPAA